MLVTLVLLEVLDEAASQILCLLFPLSGICVGVAGIEDGGIDTGQSGGDLKVEVGDLLGGSLVDGTAQDGVDDAAGILTLTIPALGTIQLSGFPVVTDLGKGEPGDTGTSGRAGVDGTIGRDGDQGPSGCVGPTGTRGDPGRDGPRGVQGPEGPRGPEGPKGDPGKDGALQVYMQVEDPATTGQNVQAGAIWIIP
jgi:hypothetical protein